jgi:hypothetical protein
MSLILFAAKHMLIGAAIFMMFFQKIASFPVVRVFSLRKW